MQEISSLVGEVRTEASEAETVAVVTEEEELMQTDSQAGDMEPSVASVLQVHVEASEAATQVHTHTHTHHNTIPTWGDQSACLCLRWSPQTVDSLRS